MNLKIGRGNLQEAIVYFRQLRSFLSRSTGGTFLRLLIVGVLGLCVDLALFQLLREIGQAVIMAQAISFLGVTIFSFFLNARWTFLEITAGRVSIRYAQFLLVCLLALFLRSAVVLWLLQTTDFCPLFITGIGACTSALINYTGSYLFVFPGKSLREKPKIHWNLLAFSGVGYLFLFRLIYSGVIDLIPEEAYYWNYARNLSLGYLDHPPLVAWLIKTTTSVFGDTELGLRLPANICWLLTAYFMYRFTEELFDRSTAIRSLLIVSLMPFFFATGFLMTPDAPLTLAWVGCLFYLWKALVKGQKAAWIPAGIFLGIGFLSKYTIGLLVVSAAVYMVLDRRSRKQFFSPYPYLSSAIALLLFLPVIIWNVKNGFASFYFQGPGRWADSDMSTGLFGFYVFLFLGPSGIYFALRHFFPGNCFHRGEFASYGERDRRFINTFVVIPLLVFLVHSFFGETKLNWTGPVWFALVPFFASTILSITDTGRTQKLFRCGWKWVFTSFLLIYGSGFLLLSIGAPYFPEEDRKRLPVAWEQLGDKLEKIETRLKKKQGMEPMVIGMDRHFMVSELSFYYDPKDEKRILDGRDLIGDNCLMWEKWDSEETLEDRTAILVADEADDLKLPRIEKYFRNPRRVRKVTVKTRYGRPLTYYVRICLGYRKCLEYEEERDFKTMISPSF